MPLAASISAWPKNWKPALGGWFCFMPAGMAVNFISGPKL